MKNIDSSERRTTSVPYGATYALISSDGGSPVQFPAVGSRTTQTLVQPIAADGSLGRRDGEGNDYTTGSELIRQGADDYIRESTTSCRQRVGLISLVIGLKIAK